MIPKTDKDSIELFVIQPSFKDVTIIKKVKGKNVRTRQSKFIKEHWLKVWMKCDDIMIRGEFINSKGQIAKNRCAVYNRSNNNYHTVGHSLEEVNNALKSISNNKIGFKPGY